ncbi:MAG: S9 family peptidase [Clostridiaceae bacterium]|nr:S9 family peptidase [Clostridiaceae bacterium]
MNDKLNALLRTETARCPVWLDSGRTAAYIRTGDGGPRIWEIDIVTGKTRQRTFGDDRIWSIAGHHQTGSVIFCMDTGGNEHEQVYLLERGSNSPKDMTLNPNARHFLGGLSPDGRMLTYASNRRTPETFDIWACDTASGEQKMVLKNDDHYNWPPEKALSPNGRYLLYNKLLGTSDNALWMLDLSCGNTNRVPAGATVSAEVHPAWKHDSSGFFLITDRDAEYPYIAEYSIYSGKMEKRFEYPFEAETLALSSDDRYLAVVINENSYKNLRIFDLQEGTEANCPHSPKGVVSDYSPLSWSPEGHKLLFTLSSGKRPENVWMLDIDADSLRPLTYSNMGGLIPDDLCEPQLMHYHSFDGLEIPFWLYVPHNAEPKNMPLVIEIHGGPEGQEMPSFTPFLQYLVSEGIAVAAPNVRGSTGYGKTFTHLDDVEKRLDSVKDIASLVEYLVSQQIADKERLAVNGMSYGGFMTLSCATRMPELWCCAIDMVGMYNLETFLENTAEYRRAHRENEYGSLALHRDILRKVSPIAKIDDIQAPLMVIQGRNDPRVPAEEAEQVVSALRQKGHTVEYICYDDEGHGISKVKNQLDCYPKMAAFLKRYMHIE